MNSEFRLIDPSNNTGFWCSEARMAEKVRSDDVSGYRIERKDWNEDTGERRVTFPVASLDLMVLAEGKVSPL